jgi:hypothetical protein
MGKRLMRKHGLTDWSLGVKDGYVPLMRPGDILGGCFYKTKLIYVKVWPGQSRASVRETLLHEIAHALTPRNGHGLRWQRKARELGVSDRNIARSSGVQHLPARPGLAR